MQSKVASHPSLHIGLKGVISVAFITSVCCKLICGQPSTLKLHHLIVTSKSVVEIILHTPGSVCMMSFVGNKF